MTWRLVPAVVMLLGLQCGPPPIDPTKIGDEASVSLGAFSFSGHWLDIDGVHVHNAVNLRSGHEPEGTIWVTVGDSPGTELTFQFSRDSSGRTRAVVAGMWSLAITGDMRRDRLWDLKSEVQLHTDDWGPGKTLNCRFSVRGERERTPTWILGAFSVKT